MSEMPIRSPSSLSMKYMSSFCGGLRGSYFVKSGAFSSGTGRGGG